MVPVAAKAGALLAVAAAGSTSIWYFSDSIFGTSLVSIADENPAPTTYGNTSIGKNYSKYFLSSKNNKKTWEDRHKEYKDRFSGDGTDKAKDKFSTVASAFSKEEDTGNTTSLNKICEDAYKEATASNLVDTAQTTTEATKFFKPNVWEFCGLGKIVTLDKEPKVGDTATYESKIGGDTTNNKLFVSTKVDSNDWFWNLKTKEFWANKNKVTGTDSTKHELKKLAENADSEKKNESIKKTCQAIYEKISSDDSDNKNKDDALVFCSIKLTLPSA